MKETKKTHNIYIVYFVVLLFYLWMAFQIPYTHDDWDWGLDIGMYQFLNATVNSRFVGNFFVVIMTRSEFLKAAIMGSVCFFIPYIMMHLITKDQEVRTPQKKLIIFLICNCLLITMNQRMWSTVYGWVSGFANFAISAVFLFPWIKELFCALNKASSDSEESIIKVALHFFIAFFCQLFLENIAIYCTLIAVVLCAIYYKSEKQIPKRIILMLLGAVVGLIIMFSSEIYTTLFVTGNAVGSYREIPLLGSNSISDVLYTLFVQICVLGGRLYTESSFLSVSMLVLMMFWMNTEKCKVNNKRKRIYIAINTILIFTLGICYIFDNICVITSKIVYIFDFLVSAIYFVTITVEILIYFKQGIRAKLLGLWISAPFVIIPLIITTESGHRLFFTANIFIILSVVLLFTRVMEFVPNSIWKRAGIIVACITLMLFIFYGKIYSDIGACKKERDNVICKAIETSQEEIVLPAFPHSEYLHCPNPNVEHRIAFFREFYGIPENINIVFE